MEEFLIGQMRLDPTQVYWMTPLEISRAIQGYRKGQVERWQPFVLLANCLGADIDLHDLFPDAHSADRVEEFAQREAEALKREREYITDLHGEVYAAHYYGEA